RIRQSVLVEALHVGRQPAAAVNIRQRRVVAILTVEGFQLCLDRLDVCLALRVTCFLLDAAIGCDDEQRQDTDNDDYDQEFDDRETLITFFKGDHKSPPSYLYFLLVYDHCNSMSVTASIWD